MLEHPRIIGSLSAGVEYDCRAPQCIENDRERYTWMDMISRHHPLERINEAVT